MCPEVVEEVPVVPNIGGVPITPTPTPAPVPAPAAAAKAKAAAGTAGK